MAETKVTQYELGSNIISAIGLAATYVVAVPSQPLADQKLIYRFKDNGTARTITWNAIFRAVGATLPVTTVINKTTYVGCVYNAVDSKWDVIAVSQEA